MANPLQYSCLENPMDRGAWWAKVYRATKNWTQLKQISTHTHEDLVLQKLILHLKYHWKNSINVSVKKGFKDGFNVGRLRTFVKSQECHKPLVTSSFLETCFLIFINSIMERCLCMGFSYLSGFQLLLKP